MPRSAAQCLVLVKELDTPERRKRKDPFSDELWTYQISPSSLEKKMIIAIDTPLG